MGSGKRQDGLDREPNNEKLKGGEDAKPVVDGTLDVDATIQPGELADDNELDTGGGSSTARKKAQPPRQAGQQSGDGGDPTPQRSAKQGKGIGPTAHIAAGKGNKTPGGTDPSQHGRR